MTRRVVITGMGGVTAFGDNWQDVSRGLLTYKNAVRNMPEWQIYDGLNTLLGAPIDDFALPRITSYNVCYTKLLRTLLMVLPGAKINSSVLALLPEQALGSIPPELNDGFMQRLDKQLVWLVSPGQEADPDIAAHWQTLLQQSHAFREVKGVMDADSQKAWGSFFWQHRNGLIDGATRARLQHGGEAQAQWILSQLYSAFSGVSGREIQNDP